MSFAVKNEPGVDVKTVVQKKIETYPASVVKKLLELRELILTVITDCDLGEYEETLKWGEPSFLVSGGSTVRFDWKEKDQDHYFLFFNCNTSLVETFRELYSDELEFDGNRAIVLKLSEPLPVNPLRHCIELSLRYKSIKHLPLLGA